IMVAFEDQRAAVAQPGDEVTIVVRARDFPQPPQPRGKQSQRYERHGCHYTRTTGIWQTVWMEPVSRTSLLRTRLTPDVANSCVHLEQPIRNAKSGTRVRAVLSDQQGPISAAEAPADLDFAPRLTLGIPEQRRRLWSISDPHLYQIGVELLDANGKVMDQISSYAGLRSVSIEGKAIKINGTSVFQRLVLDQGYYPDGILTAPTEEVLIKDIELSQAVGFNGARLHQKVFEERFLYHCDRLGYIVWGEFPDWGGQGYGRDDDHWQPGATYITQWLEEIERDYSHPSIIGWCPLNETWQTLHDGITVLDDVTRGMFLATKAMDTTRPVLDASGYSHRVREADVYDSHDYNQDPAKFKETHAGLAQDKPFLNTHGHRVISIPYAGQPYFVSEFGGIWWNPNAKPGEDSWGYGERPKTLEEFYTRFEGLCRALLEDAGMFGYCYTQLTDVYQEQNGIFTFDRRNKFDLERMRRIQQQKAAIE
ncbi:MAG TPA: glycoside hydrolase family 2 TIM barrel-domain containing protein, partial [bacterium]|nr:glycoside hydrolase family 2 TIM barrel-domain containing protein [bacterium]